MRAIEVELRVPTINLVEIAPDKYRFFVQIRNTGGNPLNHANIPNSTQIDAEIETVDGSDSVFILPVPTTLSHNQFVNNVVAAIYKDSLETECFRQETFNIAVGCDKTGVTGIYYRGASAGSPMVPFASHAAAADAGCNSAGSGGLAYFSAGIGVGSRVFQNTVLNNCNTIPDGYYYFRTTLSVLDPHPFTGRIQSGVITEVQAFTCDPDGLGANSEMMLYTTPGTVEED